MAKAGGGTRNGARKNDIAVLKKSSNWFIREGINKYDSLNSGFNLSDLKNLSDDQKRYVVAYMSHSYGVVNKQLRNGNVSTDVKLMTKGIDDGLSHIAKYEGEVYRGVRFDSTKDYRSTIEYYKSNIGKTVTDKAYVSTGKEKKKVVRKFTSNNNSIVFTISSKNGRDVSRFNDEEKEVIFKRNTKFKVLSVRGNNIHLEEK